MIFKDKTVIITGGSEGVGAAAARKFAEAGANLMLVARGKRNLDAIADAFDVFLLDAMPMVEYIDLAIAPQRITAALMSALGGAALLLASLGIGGLAVALAAQKPIENLIGAGKAMQEVFDREANVSREELKKALAHVSVKSHANGALNPKAHLRKAVSEEQIMASPIIAHPLGLFDCCGVSDGSACAIVTTPEIAKENYQHKNHNQ